VYVVPASDHAAAAEAPPLFPRGYIINLRLLSASCTHAEAVVPSVPHDVSLESIEYNTSAPDIKEIVFAEPKLMPSEKSAKGATGSKSTFLIVPRG
jgi:hypothetical protein